MGHDPAPHPIADVLPRRAEQDQPVFVGVADQRTLVGKATADPAGDLREQRVDRAIEFDPVVRQLRDSHI